MPRTSEFDYGADRGTPDFNYANLRPDVDPIKALPDFNRYGESNDLLYAIDLKNRRDARLLNIAQGTIPTQFFRYALSIGGGLVTGTAGAMAGGGMGLAAGYAGASVASFVSEKILGITIPQEIVDFGTQAAEAVAVAAGNIPSFEPLDISNYIPSEVTDTLAQAGEAVVNVGYTFYSHIMAGISGISVGSFVAGKTAPYGWNKGDGWGRNIGTKVSLPFVRMSYRAKKIQEDLTAELFDV